MAVVFYVATEAANQARLALILADIAQGRIDADLEPTMTAWWLLTIGQWHFGPQRDGARF